MTAEWFVDETGPIVETAWGHYQDVPIFRALATQHNVGLAASRENRLARSVILNTALFLEVTGGSGNTSEEDVHLMIYSNDGEPAQGWFNKAELIQAIANGGYGE